MILPQVFLLRRINNLLKTYKDKLFMLIYGGNNMSIKNLSSQEYDILNKIAAKTEQSASGAVDICDYLTPEEIDVFINLLSKAN